MLFANWLTQQTSTVSMLTQPRINNFPLAFRDSVPSRNSGTRMGRVETSFSSSTSWPLSQQPQRPQWNKGVIKGMIKYDKVRNMKKWHEITTTVVQCSFNETSVYSCHSDMKRMKQTKGDERCHGVMKGHCHRHEDHPVGWVSHILDPGRLGGPRTPRYSKILRQSQLGLLLVPANPFINHHQTSH